MGSGTEAGGEGAQGAGGESHGPAISAAEPRGCIKQKAALAPKHRSGGRAKRRSPLGLKVKPQRGGPSEGPKWPSVRAQS